MSNTYQTGQGTPFTSYVHVSKAEPVGGKTVPDLHLIFDGELGRCATLDESKARFSAQAKQIALALRAHLPGGTLDQLLIELLQLKASHFVVPYGTPKEIIGG